MKVREVMTQGVKTVRPNCTVQDAARLMKDMDVGPLPVCDGNRISGMVTDRDITIRSTAEGKNPGQQRVDEVMTSDVIFCRADDDVSEAARLMHAHQVRRLLVLSDDNRLAGIVSLGDVATQSDEATAGHALEGISEPATPRA